MKESTFEQERQLQTVRSDSTRSSDAVEFSWLSFNSSLSAQSWVVSHRNTILASWNCSHRREIASLTKIMTCLVAVQYLEENPRTADSYVKVSVRSASTEGTTSGLRKGEKVKLIDLLYGLMLPSGNDAAVAIAEFLGKKLLKNNKNRHNVNDPMRAFLSQMNSYAIKLGMFETFYANPHGMSFPKNKSSARDVSVAATHALTYPLFQKVVSTKEHSCSIVRKSGTHRNVNWNNTNKLLAKGFFGVKTGITPKAGPCLCAYNGEVVVVLLNSNSLEDRWEEAQKLAELGSSIIRGNDLFT